MSRTQYLLWALGRSISAGAGANACPACGETESTVVHRKYVVTALRECRNCALRFRTPKDDPDTTEAFYSDEIYRQGYTTSLPSNTELEVMVKRRFAGTGMDCSDRLALLAAAGIKPGSRILDFGSSWGYGSWQMKQEGFEVFSYEIGQQRARYAKEKLECTMVSDLRTLDGSIDCFFSSHVIEHLPTPRSLFEDAKKALKPSGIFVCYSPNGAVEREAFDGYHKSWGQIHPFMITPEYLKGEAYRHGFTRCAVFSRPLDYENVAAFRDGELSGDELLMIADYGKSATLDHQPAVA